MTREMKGRRYLTRGVRLKSCQSICHSFPPSLPLRGIPSLARVILSGWEERREKRREDGNEMMRGRSEQNKTQVEVTEQSSREGMRERERTRDTRFIPSLIFSYP